LILIIDDSTSERMLLKARLQQLGHQVMEAADGSQALMCLSEIKGDVDLVLLDVCMPGIDGFETARRIRLLEKGRGEEWCPIIFLSGRSDPEDISLGIESGGDDYLTKPADTIVLRAKIAAMQRIAAMRQKLLEMQQQLEVQANKDELTNLPNRRHFMETLEKELVRARRYSTPFSIAYMDLDHFKQINDTHGHEAGDVVLRTIAKAIADSLRGGDTIGRVGGEEFCFSLPGVDAADSVKPCERYRMLIEQLPIQSGSQTLKMTASFGITSFRPETDDAISLIARADKALYRAKELGRNRVVVI